jgi:predicted DNA-binding antitoxin AbrB/MazE fold protein
MNPKISAIFNGEVFHPTEPLDLKPNTKVKLTVETELIDEQQLKLMANDPDILGEIFTIDQEFMKTEMDGLKELSSPDMN